MSRIRDWLTPHTLGMSLRWTLSARTHRSPATALHVACHQGHPAPVAFLLTLPKIDPNIVQDGQWTPLALAIHVGNLKALLCLLADHRVEVNKCAQLNASPLFWAVNSDKEPVAQTLFASGSWIDTSIRSTHHNLTAIEFAKGRGYHTNGMIMHTLIHDYDSHLGVVHSTPVHAERASTCWPSGSPCSLVTWGRPRVRGINSP